MKNIEGLYNHMLANAVRVTELVDRDGCGINFQFYDPDGNYFDVNDDYRIFIPLSNADTGEDLFSLLKRKLGSKEPLADWETFSDALTRCSKLPGRVVLHDWEKFRSSLPEHADLLLQRLENHNRVHPEKHLKSFTGKCDNRKGLSQSHAK